MPSAAIDAVALRILRRAAAFRRGTSTRRLPLRLRRSAKSSDRREQSFRTPEQVGGDPDGRGAGHVLGQVVGEERLRRHPPRTARARARRPPGRACGRRSRDDVKRCSAPEQRHQLGSERRQVRADERPVVGEQRDRPELSGPFDRGERYRPRRHAPRRGHAGSRLTETSTPRAARESGEVVRPAVGYAPASAAPSPSAFHQRSRSSVELEAGELGHRRHPVPPVVLVEHVVHVEDEEHQRSRSANAWMASTQARRCRRSRHRRFVKWKACIPASRAPSTFASESSNRMASPGSHAEPAERARVDAALGLARAEHRGDEVVALEARR